MKKFLLESFTVAVARCQPAIILPRYLPDLTGHTGRIIVVGAGKASAAMAKALEDHYQRSDIEGIVITRYGYGAPTQKIKIVEAAHPVPDAQGLNAAQDILKLVSGLSPDDLVIALISGGGSSLLPVPAPGISLADKQALNKALLACGAPIDDMNCVRKHISGIKGGQLARAIYPAKLVSLIISDVPSNDPSVVASGPTCPDEGTQAQALEIIRKYGIPITQAMKTHLENPAHETPKANDPVFQTVQNIMIARGQDALDAAAGYAATQGYDIINLGDGIEGEARDAARDMVQKVLDISKTRTKPFIVLSGGETTITIKGTGHGGRNQEFALAAAMAAQGHSGIYGIACDTDGIDGSKDVAGAMFTPTTLSNAQSKGLDPQAYLANNDSYGFFEKLGDHLVDTGPTCTNVNDFRAIVFVP